MTETEFYNSLALFLLRTVTGIIFFFQGYDKIFNVKIKNVVETFQEPIDKTYIPNSLLKPFSWITSSLEMLGGLLLIFGVLRGMGLVLLSIDMLLVAFAFSNIKAMWDMQYYFPRFIFLLILLLLPQEWDLWNLDAFLK
ncbi:MAG: DoxX family protein [Bacteroidetes bacterium]|nr:MAG: DoxX family protein [Bacteroidota bacterium]